MMRKIIRFSIQFILYRPISQITNVPQRAFQSVPGPPIGSEETPIKYFFLKFPQLTDYVQECILK